MPEFLPNSFLMVFLGIAAIFFVFLLVSLLLGDLRAYQFPHHPEG